MRHTARILSAIGLAALLAATLLFGLAGHNAVPASRKFDQEAWLQPVESCKSSPRGRMVNDLVSNHLRPGMPMSRVNDLLGPPAEVTADRVWFYPVSFENDFLLGTCVGLQLYATRGRLKRAKVTRDD